MLRPVRPGRVRPRVRDAGGHPAAELRAEPGRLTAAGAADPLVESSEAGRLARLRARGIPDAPQPLLPREGFAYWVAWLQRRVARHYDAVVLLTGPTGSSKSTLGLRMAQAMDRKFDMGWLCYTPQALMAAYERLRPGQPVLFDEGVRGLMAGDQSTAEQKALVRALALVREKSGVLFVCAPSIWLIAKQVRQGRATLWVQVLGRGVGLVHERDERLRYEPDSSLGFSRSARAPYLLWDKFAENSRLWRSYMREKQERLDEFLSETREMLEKKAARRGGKSDADRRKEHRDAVRRSRARAAPTAGDVTGVTEGAAP